LESNESVNFLDPLRGRYDFSAGNRDRSRNLSPKFRETRKKGCAT
jgi:hypothetical protein